MSTLSHINEEAKISLNAHHPGALEVRRVQFDTEVYGRGVFTTVDIPRGTLVENAHAIRIERGEYEAHLSKTCLEHYVYSSPSKNGDMYLALGIGSLFNHADPPNLDYRVIIDELRVEYYAARAIAKGEELCIYYGRAVWWTVPQKEIGDETENEALPFGGDDE